MPPCPISSPPSLPSTPSKTSSPSTSTHHILDTSVCTVVYLEQSQNLRHVFTHQPLLQVEVITVHPIPKLNPKPSMLFRSRNNVISSAFHRGFSKRGGGACSVYRQRASIRGGGGSLEGENESVWWSEKEKEKERGKQWRRKA